MGFSADGMMAGPADKQANILICDFNNPTVPSVGQYAMTGYTSRDITAHSTSGTTGMLAYQTGSSSVMMWSRGVNNGGAQDAQISLTNATYIVWAVGTSNAYSSMPMPLMGSTVVDLSGVASVTPSPSPSASAVSPSAAPSPQGYTDSAQITTGLMLWWNRVGDVFNFKAELSSLAW